MLRETTTKIEQIKSLYDREELQRIFVMHLDDDMFAEIGLHASSKVLEKQAAVWFGYELVSDSEKLHAVE